MVEQTVSAAAPVATTTQTSSAEVTSDAATSTSSVVEATSSISAVETSTTNTSSTDATTSSTLLGSTEKPVVKTEGEVKPVEETKTVADTTQTVEAPVAPTYEAFKLPEGVTADTEKLSEFTKMLGDLELDSKYDHAKMQEFGQSLIDRHVAEVKNTLTRYQEAQTAAWEKQANEWKEAFIKDPEIGGNRQQTTVNSALEFIRRHGGTPEQQAEFRNLMETTKVGNHPAMIRLLAKANMAMSEGKPLAASAPAMKTSKVAAMYGKKK